jgi:hypothetical protein
VSLARARCGGPFFMVPDNAQQKREIESSEAHRFEPEVML